MARVVIIGGAGHVGTFLVPRLVAAGHEVTNISRGASRPYLPHAAWGQVTQIVVDRAAEEAAGLVRSGMWLDYGAVLGQPDAFDEALARRLGEVTNLRFRSVLTARPRAVLEADLAALRWKAALE